MIKNTLTEILKERKRIAIETDDNWDYGIEQCWKRYLQILTENLDKTFVYFQNECTNEELYYLAEIFEELAEETQSRELINVLRARLAMVTPETYHQHDLKCKHMQKHVDYAEFVRSVGEEIDFAEGKLDTPSESYS